MKLALVTYDALPDWEVDDRPLEAALRARGATVEAVPWRAAVDWSNYDGALVRTPWDYWHHLDAFLAWAQATAAVTSLTCAPDVIRWNLRKTYLRDLAEDGVPIAPTRWLDADDAPHLAAHLDALGGRRFFLKPVVGGAAHRTLRFGADAVEEARTHLREGGPYLLQPYLPGVEVEGELSVVAIDGVPTHAVRKVPVPGDYRVQDDFGASDAPHPLDADLAALASAALDAATARLGHARPPLYARVDALRLPTGALVLNELELVEPSLFFRHGRHAAEALAGAWLARLADAPAPVAG